MTISTKLINTIIRKKIGFRDVQLVKILQVKPYYLINIKYIKHTLIKLPTSSKLWWSVDYTYIKYQDQEELISDISFFQSHNIHIVNVHKIEGKHNLIEERWDM